MVEVTGIEPATSASRTQRSTKLSHTSKISSKLVNKVTRQLYTEINWNVNLWREGLNLNRHILYSIENILEMLPKIIVGLYDKLKFIILARRYKNIVDKRKNGVLEYY